MTTDELLAEVKAALAEYKRALLYWDDLPGKCTEDEAHAISTRIKKHAPEWLGALVQAVEDLREKLGRANEQNQYCHDNHSPGQQMVIESQTQQLHDVRAEVAQLRTDGQRLAWLREHYFGANFRYGEPEESVLIFGPLPKGAKITGDFDADIGALAPPRAE